MPALDIASSGVSRRWNSNTSAQERISSVANLVEVRASSETLSSEPASRNEKSKKTGTYSAFKGFLFTFLCSLFITLSSLIVKKMTYISPGELSLVRNVGVLLGNIPIVVYTGEDPLGPKSKRLLLTIRSLLAATAIYVNLLAYRLLPFAEAAVIMSTTPAVTMVTARIFLKESCGVVPIIALMITISGVILYIRLPALIATNSLSTFTVETVSGIASAVGCVLLWSVTFVVIRKMRDVHFSVMMIYLGFLGAVENAILTASFSYFARPRCGLDIVLVLLVALFGFFGNSCLTLAIQSEEVGIVSVLKASLDIVIAMILQIIFYRQYPDAYNLGGAALVIISVTIIGVRKWLQGKPKDSLVRRRLRILLF